MTRRCNGHKQQQEGRGEAGTIFRNFYILNAKTNPRQDQLREMGKQISGGWPYPSIAGDPPLIVAEGCLLIKDVFFMY